MSIPVRILNSSPKVRGFGEICKPSKCLTFSGWYYIEKSSAVSDMDKFNIQKYSSEASLWKGDFMFLEPCITFCLPFLSSLVIAYSVNTVMVR
jgi:hypothetical protein